MQKMVLALDVHDELKCRKKVFNLVSSVAGVDSISLDVKEKKLTLIGSMDLIQVANKLKKAYQIEVITIGPAKEPEKKNEEEKEKPKPNPEPEVVTPIIYHPYYPKFYYELDY